MPPEASTLFLSPSAVCVSEALRAGAAAARHIHVDARSHKTRCEVASLAFSLSPSLSLPPPLSHSLPPSLSPSRSLARERKHLSGSNTFPQSIATPSTRATCYVSPYLGLVLQSLEIALGICAFCARVSVRACGIHESALGMCTHGKSSRARPRCQCLLKRGRAQQIVGS